MDKKLLDDLYLIMDKVADNTESIKEMEKHLSIIADKLDKLISIQEDMLQHMA